ncbi:alpha/beta hydrolase [Laspinema sp. A4]|uniref:alpha/beta fold hydrolase n=1 Tax=Laspinema sp. D2d TaxID=2953686 RepID=UPI0021BAC445|nr:alpha/beta hydrolase [Laspinema sp. D2d]MCT7984356.1 alpha/beta hydrolase [Laspinema sp. D2d]
MTLPLRNSRIKLSQGQLFWREVGQEGLTLVFLHGSWSDSAQWVSVIERLRANYHCFALDLLGFGESEQPNIHYSIALQVECLHEFLETVNPGPVYLVGDSLGAWVAASYALKYPEVVPGLVLLTPEGVQVEGLKNRWFRTRLWIQALPLIRKLQSVLFPLARILRLHQVMHQALLNADRLQKFGVACQILFQRRQSEIEGELLQDRLSWLKIPALILIGDRDTPTAVALAETYHRAIADADLRRIPEGHSNLPEELPDLVAQQIRDFISNREAQTEAEV